MKWHQTDYLKGLTYLAGHEEEALLPPVLNTGGGVIVIPPKGLPACKTPFPSLALVTPLILFSGLLALVPILEFFKAGGFTRAGLTLSAVCLLFLWWTAGALRSAFKDRSLFPREYFVTLGPKGIAMHFPRLHFPFTDSRTAIEWKDTVFLHRKRMFFFPALLTGNFCVVGLEVHSSKGGCVRIPLNLPRKTVTEELRDIENLIRVWMQKDFQRC